MRGVHWSVPKTLLAGAPPCGAWPPSVGPTSHLKMLTLSPRIWPPGTLRPLVVQMRVVRAMELRVPEHRRISRTPPHPYRLLHQYRLYSGAVIVTFRIPISFH